MIRCLSLTAGHWSELNGARREPGAIRPPESLTWLAGEAMTTDELQLAHRWCEALGVPPAAVERLFAEPRAHLERGEDYIVLIVDTVELAGDEVRTGHVMCVLARHAVATLCLGPSHLPDAVEQEVRQLSHPHGREESVVVLSTLLTEVLADAEEVESRLSEQINDIEQAMFTTRMADPVEQIYTLKRKVSKTDYVVGSLARPLERLSAGEGLPNLAGPAQPRLHRLKEWAHRLGQLLQADDRMLGDMLQVHLTQVSVRQNEDMRKISAWAGLVAVPTLISGVYGMNFVAIPWLHEQWGFPVVMGAMVIVCVVLYRVFKRSGWL